jgi:hypothetical protein
MLAPTNAETKHPRAIGIGCLRNTKERKQPRKKTRDAKTNLMTITLLSVLVLVGLKFTITNKMGSNTHPFIQKLFVILNE